ncbi:acyl CoA:acetate/3-ketoacid CoA transferase [Bacillus tuaregi]|uniref:acyl CoA:acetate/3-ketoacid CoA transferase n=1 Tax=Bacillus tuaregi TaxID=1816695 RepID=UPI0008F8987B|nr:malonate decarboxylase subunit alpha [Bacillus tuaregi]
MSKKISLEQATKLINDGDIVATTASSGLAGLPEELIVGIGERYKAEGSPKNITFVNGSGIGINSEGRGMDHIAHEGLVKRVISGHAGFSHRMSRFISEGKVEGYLFPQGVLTQIWRSTAGNKPGVLTKVGLGTFVDPRIQGAKANSITTEDLIRVVELNGEEWLHYPNIDVKVALIRGTTADENGNITTEHEAANFEILALATAARNNGGIVIAQVENIAKAGALDPKKVRVPGVLVDYIVVSEKPEYHSQTMARYYHPALSGEMRVPLGSIEPVKLNAKKIIARRAAMELSPSSIVNLGVGMPALVSNVAAEEGVSDEMTLTVEFGIFGGVPASGFDFGASYNPEAIINHDAMFDFYDGGGLDAAFLGLAQVDQYGNVNVSQFGPKVVGPGGFINISQSSKKVVFMGQFTVESKEKIENNQMVITNHGKGRKIVNNVEQITFSGEYASKAGIPVLYVTERAVFDVVDGKLRLIEIAPGLDLEEDILAWMDFRPLIDDSLKPMDPSIFQEQWGGLKEIIDEKRRKKVLQTIV